MTVVVQDVFTYGVQNHVLQDTYVNNDEFVKIIEKSFGKYTSAKMKMKEKKLHLVGKVPLIFETTFLFFQDEKK